MIANENRESTEPERQQKTKKKRKRRSNRKKKEEEDSLEKMFRQEIAACKKRLEEKDVPLSDNNEVMEVTGKEVCLQDSNKDIICDHVTLDDALPTGPAHKSGRDAFATGFYFLQSALTRAQISLDGKLTIEGVVSVHEEHRNKVPINGKPFPLLITKSFYCDNSTNHKRIQEEMLLKKRGEQIS